MISEKSQGSVAAHLKCGGLFNYHLTTYLSLSLAVKEILKLVNTLQSYRQKDECLVCPVRLAMFWLKMKN